MVERSFAHLLETGGLRRTYLRGLENNEKRYLAQVSAFNLGIGCASCAGSAPRGALPALSRPSSALSRPLFDGSSSVSVRDSEALNSPFTASIAPVEHPRHAPAREDSVLQRAGKGRPPSSRALPGPVRGRTAFREHTLYRNVGRRRPKQ
jgi:hypothetical protein